MSATKYAAFFSPEERLVAVPLLLEDADAELRHPRKVADQEIELEVLKEETKISRLESRTCCLTT